MSQVSLSVRWGHVGLATLSLLGLTALCGVRPVAAVTPAGTRLTSAAQVEYHDGGPRVATSNSVTVTVRAGSGLTVDMPVSRATVAGTQAFPCTVTNFGDTDTGVRFTVTMTSNTYAYVVADENGDGIWQSAENTMLRSLPSLEPGASLGGFLLVRAMPGTPEGAAGGITVFVSPLDDPALQTSAEFTATYATPRFSPAFSFTTPDAVTSSPIVRNGLALMGTEPGILYAVRADGADAGSLAWRFPAEGSLGAPIRARVASDDEYHFVVADNGMIYKLDAMGQPVWSAQVAEPGSRMEAMPILHEKRVTLACGDGRVRHIDRETGEVLGASIPVGRGTLGTPALPGMDDMWVGGADGNLYNMRVDDAFTVLSAHPISSQPMSATPFVDSRCGVVVAVSAEGDVFAMKMRSSSLVWGPVSLGGPVKGSPYIHVESGIAYFTTTSGWLHALRMEDGSAVPGYPVQLTETGELVSSPVVLALEDRTTVFVASTDGALYAVNAALPSMVARFDTADPVEPFLHTPALSGSSLDDVLVAAAGGTLYGFLVRDAADSLQ